MRSELKARDQELYSTKQELLSLTLQLKERNNELVALRQSQSGSNQ
jgi:hypothetical protein